MFFPQLRYSLYHMLLGGKHIIMLQKGFFNKNKAYYSKLE